MKTRQSRRKEGEAPALQPRLHTILYAIAALVAVGGLADATYLTVAHMAGEHVACGGSVQCSQVLSSKYATVAGVPLAALGGAGYFLAFSLATLLAFGYARLRLPLVLMVTAMFLGTLWLLYLQAFVLHAYCTYCLLSAACVFVLAGVMLAIPPRK